MSFPNPAPPATRLRAARPLRVAALLLAATVAAGAAAKLGRSAPAAGAAGPARSFAAASTGPIHFRGTLEGGAVLPARDRDVRLELVIGADAAPGPAAVRAPTDLVVVLDRSGSMLGEKMEQARAAVRALIANLGDADRFALVTYSDGAQIAIPLEGAAGRARWSAVVDAIRADGGTAMSVGLDRALDLVDAGRRPGRVPRVVLISDGLANQGDVSREGLLRRAARAARGEYALSTVGVGADFDEGLMAALADAGTGNFHFLASATGLDRVLASEFATARDTVASGLRVAIEPAPGVRVVDAAGYPLAREGAEVAFQPGALFSGQERRVWVTFEVPAHASGDVPLGRVALEYTAAGERHRLVFTETPHVAAVADERRYFMALDTPTWERSVVVDQYNALRRSVAEAVKDGRAREAIVEIQKYRADVAAKNQRVQSPTVVRQLDEAAHLQHRMEAAASGAAPMSSIETKQLRALGYLAGRPGSQK
jgi:Ca-activated chloride channel family protein